MEFKTNEWIRKVRDEFYEQTKNLTPEAQIQFIKEKAEAAQKRIEELRRRKEKKE